MKVRHLLTLTTLLLTGTPAAIANTTAPQVFANEKNIVFENDGQKVLAFEGMIEVSENRSKPNSRKIPLKYIRFPATGNKTGSPIIYLAGGPGGSGIAAAQYPNFRFPLFMALREFGDVIALDQRGTGASDDTPECISKQKVPTTKVLSDNEIAAIYKKAAKECVDFWTSQGVDVWGYTTQESVQDLNDLRQHFKAEKVTLWGISYGSHLALASLNSISKHIDKVVIASAEGLDQTVKYPAQTDAYFDRLQLAINQQPAAAKAYPELKQLMRRVHAQLEKKPLALSVPQKDGSQLELLFQRSHLQGFAAAMIADPGRAVPMLLNLYQTLDQGNTAVLSELLKLGYIDDKPISFKVMSLAMDIASGITPERLKVVNQQAKTALLGKALNFPMPQLNKVIAGLDLGDSFRTGPHSDVPTLLLSGTLDGRTYPQSQREATQGLSKLTQVMVVNGGHNLFMSSPKVTEVIKDFLRGDPINTTEIQVELPPFVK
jgi:pimeloyl-ACP methyl ester carboxylesterase